MSLAESLQDRTQVGRAGQGGGKRRKVSDVAAGIPSMDAADRLLITVRWPSRCCQAERLR